MGRKYQLLGEHPTRNLGVVAVALLAFAMTAPAVAQETYPSRPVTIQHGSTPGGSTDIIARTLAAGMSDRFGQPVIVDARPGAGGAVMLGGLARAKPDGYTLGMPISAVVTQGPQIQKDLPYDPLKDFTPITKIGDQAVMIVVPSAFPAKNFGDLIAVAKTKPVTISVYAPVNKIILAAIGSTTGAQFTAVPFPGLPQGTAAVLGGHVDAGFDSPNTSMGLVKEGKYRALVVTTARRAPMQPDVPTVAETVIPGFDFGIWYGLVAPAGTPADRIDRIYREVVASLQMPKVKETLANAALDVSGMPPKEFAALIRTEYERDGGIIRKYNIQ